MVNKRSCARKWPLTSSLTGSPRQRAHPAVSSKVTQSTISAFHTLRKRRTQLQRQLEHAKGTSREELSEKARRVDADIDELGGIDAYQKASQLGQSSIRGGDSSKVLVAWLHATRYDREAGRPGTGKKASKETDVLEGQDQQCRKLKMLEIGAVSPSNYANCSKWIENHPIDLHSQHPDILEQNFFERPLPDNEADRFDVVSCSLVLNFVEDPHERGRMLALIHAHLKPESSSLLFLVLPLPCVTNSRYLSPSTLLDMMKCVGFELVEERWKEGGRVGYWLWAWREQLPAEEWARWRRKRIVTDGSRKNNFAILLTDPRWPTACDI